MSDWPALRAARAHDASARLPFAVNGRLVGSVARVTLAALRAWPELLRGCELFVRIDTGRGHGHHQHVRTAGAQSKFGVPLFELDMRNVNFA